MAPVIVAKDLCKCYAGFSPVLRGACLEVEPGEMAAIMGPSGCGKSTMLHLLGMFHAPDSGTLEILGRDVLHFSHEEAAAFRRAGMGFVMQASNLFDHSTVFENVEFPLIYDRVPPAERWERVIRALDLVRLSARVHYRSNRLSGGEQQRVAIARAMVNNPRILLADEPTGALDAHTSRVVMRNFQALCHSGGVAMVMVTHDPKMAEFCDSVYTLEDGLLVCQRRNPPVLEGERRDLLAGPEPVVRGAMVAGRFPEPSGRCVMEDAHRMHAAGLITRIHALEGGGSGNDDGYALPLPVRRMGAWRAPAILLGLFRHLRGTASGPWQLWKALPAAPGPLGVLDRLWTLGRGLLLARWCIEDDIELLYAAEAGAPAAAAWAAARMLGRPFAFAVRAGDLAHPGPDWLRKARDAAFVRCDTEDTRRKLLDLLPEADAERIVVLRSPLTLNPPESDAFPPPPPDGPLRILAAGTLRRSKGCDVLLEACAILRGRGIPFRLDIAGEGPELAALRRRARSLDLRDDVSFLGRVPHENMPDLLMRNDVFVAPGIPLPDAESDGLPSALTEAMAFGRAAVASDLPGQLEAIRHGENGLIVPHGNADALADALQRLAGDAEERARLGAAAWRSIRDLLAPERETARLVDLFRKAMENRRPAAP